MATYLDCHDRSCRKSEPISQHSCIIVATVNQLVNQSSNGFLIKSTDGNTKFTPKFKLKSIDVRYSGKA